MLELSDVSRSAGGLPVLLRVSLTLQPGERLSVLGLGAAGRRGLVKLLEGGERPDAGAIRLDGRPVTEARKRARIVRAGGEGAPLSGRSVRRAMQRAGGGDVADVAGTAGLRGELDVSVRQLSLDQRIRLGLACAVLARPRLLLLDAPAGELVGQARDELLDSLSGVLQAADRIVVLAGAADEATALGGQVLVLQNGRVEQQGLAADVMARPKNLAVALATATPALNRLTIGREGRLGDGSRFHPPPELRLPAEGASTLAFRPDDLAFERRGADCLRFAVRVADDAPSGRWTRLAFADAVWLARSPSARLARGLVVSVFVDRSKLMVFDAAGEAVAG